ncbi:unnamed protein product [Rotaria sordida]|uniref:Uncharacterized protein n=1 Tax=Rotaria sordida TaxID=392033 RepID=A0A814KA35_9BILA|nr:unnamed protein product [Rotaria sordida]CAF1374926.1 unnamed protein product [Rotaria sordida]
MGHGISREKLINDDNDASKKKRHSSSLETKVKKDSIELTEEQLREVRDAYRRSSEILICPPFCFVRSIV